eukprot:CAMPEP_0206035414 /NCGR_PEP_ID=MMETSP1466-20131121/2060_1 /ASSEMBLY_ACC=CAM_ASM_001126 /TAXON_ID=44452 /ORGANISM="Pavlova gyrans, Strain CCMP608" /LENGTH=768 /DNA_ID=CAMNT_0053409793 /DNA_START=40 /DNA_END=2343 /DNA_ORIENTATION=+
MDAAAMVEGGINDEDCDDMVNLNVLNPESILHNLEYRFGVTKPYTYVGRIVISTNPFQWIDGLYSEDTITAYSRAPDVFADLRPHVYAVARDALDKLSGEQTSQSILISGESGAGKTENTKICMSYLASVDTRLHAVDQGMHEVTARVLQTNPLLEAFGNASTTRNDNSSRFGKFIKLQYNHHGLQVGAHIDTYLLERSRVVRQSDRERNFHVFHALTGGADEALRAELGIQVAGAYHYLGRRPAADMALKASSDFADDLDVWERTCRAMQSLGFADADIAEVANALAAVLELGELTFNSQETSEGAESRPADEAVVTRAAQRLGVENSELGSKMCTRYVAAPDGWFTVHLSQQQCCNARDALAKALYGRMFDWLVSRANETIAPEAASAGGKKAATEHRATAFIGILDIFGFESFEHNSFEQLCINYANEALQAQFNAYVFAQQQAEYEAEGVPWQRVDFADNAAVLSLIEDKRAGLLTLLDEECMLGQGTISGFFTKLQTAQGKSAHFSVPRIARDTLAFTIEHYAGKVTYGLEGFLEKNNDTLHPDLVQLMQGSSSALLNGFFEAQEVGQAEGRHPPRGARKRPETVSSRFRAQLHGLTEEISSTGIHYVRCIKPNASASPTAFQADMVANQLTYAGVLEAIRISRAAYPHRMPHALFISAFAALYQMERGGQRRMSRGGSRLDVVAGKASAPVAGSKDAEAADRKTSLEMLEALLPGEGQGEGYWHAKTKVFFRPRVHERLTARLKEALGASALVVQTRYRGHA